MAPTCSGINNDFYNELGPLWSNGSDHPIALLRAENRLRNPWICEVIGRAFPQAQVLDIGCGAGFLTHALAHQGHQVTGIDLSASSLEQAARLDSTGSVRYEQASALALPFPDNSFDAVCAMDLLEHVEDPGQVIQQASRVLRPGGLFFFHTFNRNPLSWLLILKGVDWFVPQAIPQMHVYSLFIKPSELQAFCQTAHLTVQQWRGLVPDATHRSFWRLLLRKRLDPDFRFRFVRSLATGYCGYAQKNTLLD